MKNKKILTWARAAVVVFGLLAITATGCQSTIGGQTLPSPDYTEDDIQYHPAGPQDQMFNTRRAHAQYRADKQKIQDGLNQP